MATSEVQPWAAELTARIGQNIRRYRQSQEPKMTARELADRTADLGHRVEAQVLANLEVGRRASISVAELLVLAAALAVPPALLVCPLGPDGEVEPLPMWVTDPWAGYEWLTGFEAGSESAMSPASAKVISAYHQHWVRLQKVDTLTALLPPDDDQYRQAALALGALRDRMRAEGWTPPPIPDPLAEAIVRAEASEASGRDHTLDEEETRDGSTEDQTGPGR